MKKIVEGGYGDIRLRKIANDTCECKRRIHGDAGRDFGPLLPIMTYDKLEDAVSYIRDHNKPLALYLFTENDKSRTRCTFTVVFWRWLYQ